jgi:prepilin-type N-terminal cleavage/methylation domain-containing protein
VAAVTSKRRERGTTLIELLVSLALLSVIAMVTAQLVIQSTRLTDGAARTALNSNLVLAGEWLRRDTYEAAAVVGGATGWTDGPLVLVAQHGGWVAFAVVEGNLVRTDAQPGGSGTDTRVLLRGIEGWQWRVDAAASLRIEIEALANPGAHDDLTGVGFADPERRTERLTLALRGRPGGRAW